MYQLMSKKLLVAILVGLLPACSVNKYVRELPPVELMADCAIVMERLTTNGELAWTILEYRKALATCNLDKKSLREWAEQP